ncbi:helix-turn-helix domain-containing protein [Proteus mirabilis]|mgnify:CR=1 FL=1|uniref:helix-turn-helix domain-containing protein n=1 Tax=Proteus mirabilis TaxID=584 RepID=UPI000B202D4D|nr:helix-turn-helix domain-containing protein [Proteus mirabilis]ASB03307.1 helix-turn-helix domain-containing protein [Proteus mirabilis]ELA7949067.1 helix-turn-helix domain-containing protein [Proteus mirabilis]ELA8984769.1 helix-turn-helix domain-containing protein [Proteus mirabilis]MDU3453461.1 helix-turn-helix domain-containing protein [Proteus mirabilis]MDU3488893.1 helix-turn-helix domain-containing protein [Proteus mirabilis]
MSNKLTGYVWDACAVSGVKGTKLMIMVRLADYSSDEGVAYPSVETISRQIGAGISTIRNACNELERDGWLVKKQRRNGNRNASNLYFLNVDKLEKIALEENAKLRKQREKLSSFHRPDSDRSDSDRTENSKNVRFDPPESGVQGGFHPPESGGDPQVNSKHDPQVNSKHDPQELLEGKKSKNKFDPKLAKPSNVSDEVWQDWINFRKEIKKPLTETMCKQQAKKLSLCTDANAVICNSIANGWQGLFPERSVVQTQKVNSHTGFSEKDYQSQDPHWFVGGGNV